MRTVFGLILLLCFVAIASAQDQVIDKAEFDSIVAKGNNHRSVWKGEKYRMTVTTSSKALGRPQTDWASKIMVEYGSGDEFRSINSSTFGEKKNPTNESLRIGSWLYSRVDTGSWTKKTYSAPEAPKNKPESYVETISSTVEYKSLGTGTLMGKPVRIYAKTERENVVSKQTGETSDRVLKVTYWIDENGTILKNEFASESRGPRAQTQTLITTLWELDPSISFSIPEIAS